MLCLYCTDCVYGIADPLLLIDCAVVLPLPKLNTLYGGIVSFSCKMAGYDKTRLSVCAPSVSESPTHAITRYSPRSFCNSRS